MRVLNYAVLAIALSASSALAGSDSTPLSAGKPAGIRQAQSTDNTVLYVLGGTLVVVGIVAAVVSGTGGNTSTGVVNGSTFSTSATS